MLRDYGLAVDSVQIASLAMSQAQLDVAKVDVLRDSNHRDITDRRNCDWSGQAPCVFIL